ncbi:MAG: tetratricopeptide repeat protein [Armatimonadota bacterium]|nr:tetratricopeptide repeat protein [Armatimonadota bacterium]
MPVPGDPLVGRGRELAELRMLLLDSGARLLTLTGPPGVGKTRLAVECAHRCAEAFPDGTAFVDLAPLPEPSLVMSAVARVLGIRVPPGQPPVERLGTALWKKQLLLVLDNFEHLLEAAANVAHLLEAVPGLRVLATSREPLGLRGEHRFSVFPLEVPDLRDLPEVDRLVRIPSVALLVDRVRAVDRTFRLDAENARAVAELCVRLDGLPLALELAASAFAWLPPQTILERLDHRLSLLSRAARDLPERHRTLRAAVGWSYALLPPGLQRVFRRLGVFRGGWTVEAAAAVCDVPAEEMLEAVASLQDKSLVERAPQPMRFRMLESVRGSALEQLALSDEVEDAEVRHAHFYLALAKRCDAQMAGPVQAETLDRLEAEHDNLLAAIQRFLNRADTSSALGLAGALGEFWALRGYWTEGRMWLGRILERGDGEPLSRARALRALALLAWVMDDLGEAETRGQAALEGFSAAGDALGIASTLRILAHVARARGNCRRAASYLEEGLRRYREMGHPWGVAVSCSSLALVALAEGKPKPARGLLGEAMVLYRQCGDPWGVAVCLQEMGQLAHQQGRHEEARELLEQGLERFRELQDKIGIARTLADLGATTRAMDRPTEAVQWYRAGLALQWDLGSRRGIAECLEGLAVLARDPRAAARWLGAAEGLRSQLSSPPPVPQRAAIEAASHRARAFLGAFGFEVERTKGRVLPLAEVVREALAEKRNVHLSPREQEVASWIARGLTNRDIATELGVSERTVDSHVLHILNKLGFRSRAQIAAWAVEQGIASSAGTAYGGEGAVGKS